LHKSKLGTSIPELPRTILDCLRTDHPGNLSAPLITLSPLAFSMSLNSNSALVRSFFQFASSRTARGDAASVKLAVVLIGVSAVIGQIILMREWMVVFNGNEISLGIMLAIWLFWTALGSLLCGSLRIADEHVRCWVVALECALGVSLPLSIWTLRASRGIFLELPGQLAGPAPLLASLVAPSLFCVAAGALFVVAARMYAYACGVDARTASSSAYLLETLGSTVGGVAASLLLLRFLGPFQIASLVLSLNLCMAAVLLMRASWRRVGAVVVVGALFAAFFLLDIAPMLDRSSHALLWPGFHVEASRDTIYGTLTVVDTPGMRSLYQNGLILANAPDDSAAEEAVHYALLEHPAPRRILIIGGGANASIAQALKHPTIERIDDVELDPSLIDVARRYFPSESSVFSDPKVHLHLVDGRRYLQSTHERFDVIVLNLPDPETAQLNRFYTAEFFREARDHLAPDGLLSLELRSSEEVISPDLAEFLRCVERSLHEVFPYIAIIPGDTIHFFAANQANVLTEDPRVLIARLQQRKLQTQYVREYFIPFRMMPERLEQVRNQLLPLPATPVNRDFSPIAYYFNVMLWSGQFSSGYAGWLRAAAHLHFITVLSAVLAVSILVAAASALLPGRQRRNRTTAVFCMGATGFTLMALEIILLLAFQAIFGYVYSQLAILIALCMAGIALGSWISMKRDRLLGRAAAATQFLLALSCPVTMLIVGLLAAASTSVTGSLAAQCLIPALAALGGIVGGFQFPIATDIFLSHDQGRSRLGVLYAVDLLGGCAGALVLSGYIIPVFGLWKTAWLCAAVNIAPCLLALRTSLDTKSREP